MHANDGGDAATAALAGADDEYPADFGVLRLGEPFELRGLDRHDG